MCKGKEQQSWGPIVHRQKSRRVEVKLFVQERMHPFSLRLASFLNRRKKRVTDKRTRKYGLEKLPLVGKKYISMSVSIYIAQTKERQRGKLLEVCFPQYW